MLLDISYIISILIEIILPVVLAIFIWKKYRVSWAIFFLGMAFFLISLVRIPLNNLINSIILKYFLGDIAVFLSYLFASITAGLFEEGVRIIALGAVIRKKSFEKGIMYGLGHGGGGESMIFVGLSVLVSFLSYKLFPEFLPAYTITQIANIEWYMPLIGALERIFAISIQISLSVLIITAFIKRRYYLILIAVFYHILVDFVSVYIIYKYGFIPAEIMVFIFAVISAVIIFILRPKREKLLLNNG
jgi:uncharacterized membrane protein YhfC